MERTKALNAIESEVTATILVAGIGNIFLGDDGFGPEVVRHLTSPEEPPLPDGVRLVDYGIRGMHLAYDLLDGYDALILVDALPGRGEAAEVTVLEVGAADLKSGGQELDAHSMNPVAVLGSLSALGGELPQTYVVGAQPVDLDERIGLSEAMRAAVPAAAEAVRSLIANHVRKGSLANQRTE